MGDWIHVSGHLGYVIIYRYTVKRPYGHADIPLKSLFYGPQTLFYGPQTLFYGSQALIYGSQALIYGSQAWDYGSQAWDYGPQAWDMALRHGIWF